MGNTPHTAPGLTIGEANPRSSGGVTILISVLLLSLVLGLILIS